MAAHPYLKRIIEERAKLTREQARDLMEHLFSGEFTDLELAAFLGAITARGETSDELSGFVDAMRAAALPVPLTSAEQAVLVDTCGTGGDLSGTFNISTAAALVAAAAGATVAKHGNRAVTSRAVPPTCSKHSASLSRFPPPRQRTRFAITALPSSTRPACTRR